MKRRAAIAANERAGTLRRHECRGDPPHVVERLVRVDHFPVCSPALLVGRGPLTCPDDLAGYHLVHPERHRTTPKVLALREWLLAEVARDRHGRRKRRRG